MLLRVQKAWFGSESKWPAECGAAKCIDGGYVYHGRKTKPRNPLEFGKAAVDAMIAFGGKTKFETGFAVAKG